ncbi:hypothetical protein F443_12533 [Phytophthora nicotianae P1569]|uniref:Uncharacterized protein n=1 Tax=Phytophthora nicotianae P1569 TaxID=1317065 RepID=V9EW82_PHYNI|nr:hypothetical protein F443_12533 [Phytophthora nicotianae P1569]
MGRNQCHYNCQWLGNAGLLDYTRDTEAAAESLEIGQITDLLELLGAVANREDRKAVHDAVEVLGELSIETELPIMVSSRCKSSQVSSG